MLAHLKRIFHIHERLGLFVLIQLVHHLQRGLSIINGGSQIAMSFLLHRNSNLNQLGGALTPFLEESNSCL